MLSLGRIEKKRHSGVGLIFVFAVVGAKMWERMGGVFGIYQDFQIGWF